MIFGPKRAPWASPRWKAYSRLARTVHPWCSARGPKCERTKRLETHHLKYPPRPLPIWIVAPWNLMVVCKSCHAGITVRHKRRGMTHWNATVDYLGASRFARWRFWALLPWRVLAVLTAVLMAALLVL